jgi:hypothetical protein
MRQTAPVKAQAHRIAGHLAVRSGDRAGAVRAFDQAHRLATQNGARFNAAVIAAERSGATREPDHNAQEAAIDTFVSLRTPRWVERARRYAQR